MSKINRNGVIEDMTPEEEAQLEQDRADGLARQQKAEADKIRPPTYDQSHEP